MAANGDSRGLMDIVNNLIGDFRALLRQEIELVRAEVSQKVSRMGASAAVIAVGAAFAFAGMLALLACAIIALALIIPWWASTLAIGGFLVLLGGILAAVGLQRLRNTEIAPKRFTRSVRRDARAIEQGAR